MVKKVVILGHSFVRDLAKAGFESFEVEGTAFKIECLFDPGASYISMLEKGEILDAAAVSNPDFVLVILGGNAIIGSTDDVAIHQQCRNFYQELRNVLLPHCKIIAAKVELRFYQCPNKWDAPSETEYKRRRNSLNGYLQRLKLKDHILQVAGPGRLDNDAYYRDAVHLNRVGVKKYHDFVKNALAYCVRKINNVFPAYV